VDARKPATYGYPQCPHNRGGRPAQSPKVSALSQPQQQAQPQPAQQPAQAPPTPPPAPPPALFKRAWLSAYAKDFHVTAESGRKEALPLEAQRAEGGMALRGGCTAVPEDGYYMILWELGVAGAHGEATLQLGINEAASQLTYALHPGYDSGQQVTWLNAGDKLGLFAQAGDDDKAEIDCGSALLTVIRLG